MKTKRLRIPRVRGDRNRTAALEKRVELLEAIIQEMVVNVTPEAEKIMRQTMPRTAEYLEESDDDGLLDKLGV